MLKMYTVNGKWTVVDGRRILFFDTSYDAWAYVLLLKEIRPRVVPFVQRSLYPVKSLDPRPERRLKNVRLHT